VGVVVIAIGNEFSRVTGDAWSDIPVINLIFRPTLSQLFLGGVMLFTMLYRPDGLIKDWELEPPAAGLVATQRTQTQPTCPRARPA
jgi:ABC-type branched-subunit amino acid transport system permease subunit